jgi:hypothetical protein
MSESKESCSFCHQPKSKVERVIQTDDGAVSNRCVALCYDLLIGEGVDMSMWRKRALMKPSDTNT